jgi:RTX calcium-binding nonapeptide repeat (4 copies)
MIRQSHFIAVVVSFLMGCAGLLMVASCAGVRSAAPQKEEQGHTEATASEEARCEGTRTFKKKFEGVFTTNDVPDCPKGGLLSGTDGRDKLNGKDGDDEIHGLGGSDNIIGEGGNDVIYGGAGFDWPLGGVGDDVIYGGDGDDFWLHGGAGEDVLYGGKGNDGLDGDDGSLGPGPPMRDELYCGPGKDQYVADRLDHVDSSCEEKVQTLCCVG